MTCDERLKLLEAASLIAAVRNALVSKQTMDGVEILGMAINYIAEVLDNDRSKENEEEIIC